MKAKLGRLAFPALVLLALAWAILWRDEQSEPPSAYIGKKAPSFTAAALSGKQISFPAGFRNKLVLVDFWTTWCAPCRAEVPTLVEAYGRFHTNGLEIIGITLDRAQGIARQAVAAFAADNQMAWDQIYDEADVIASNYGVDTIPAAFLVDGSTGRVVAGGGELRGSGLAAAIEKHLPMRLLPADQPGSGRRPAQRTGRRTGQGTGWRAVAPSRA